MVYVWKEAKADVREEEYVEPPLSPPQIPLGSPWHWIRATTKSSRPIAVIPSRGVEGYINEHTLV